MEATFLLRLARHLARSGNQPKRMTLLTGYTGQMLYMMKVKIINDELFFFRWEGGIIQTWANCALE